MSYKICTPRFLFASPKQGAAPLTSALTNSIGAPADARPAPQYGRFGGEILIGPCHRLVSWRREPSIKVASERAAYLAAHLAGRRAARVRFIVNIHLKCLHSPLSFLFECGFCSPRASRSSSSGGPAGRSEEISAENERRPQRITSEGVNLRRRRPAGSWARSQSADRTSPGLQR